jgi:hypothetical protein
VWQRFIEPGERLAFRRIGADLADYDIHPPLYFWLLHLVTLVFGAGPRVGPVVNLVLNLGGIVLVFGLARGIFKDTTLAAWTTALWAVSPGVLQTTVHARQYSLVGVLVLGAMWCAFRLLDPQRAPGLRQALTLVALTALAVLTQYYAMIPVAGIGALAIAAWWRGERRRAGGVMGSLIVAAVVVMSAQPGLHRTLIRQQEQAREEPSPWSRRLPTVAYASTHFFAWTMGARFLVVATAAGFMIAAGIRWARDGWRMSDRPLLDREVRAAGFLLVWIAVAFAGLYVSGVSPGHALQPKYLSMLYPLVAIAVVAILRRSSWALLSLLLFMIAGTSALLATTGPGLPRAVTGEHLGGDALADATRQTIQRADRLVIDNPARGILLPVVASLDGEQAVFAAHPEDLLRQPEEWLDRLTPRSIWISDRTYSETTEERVAVHRLLEQRFEVAQIYASGRQFVHSLRARD